MENTRLQILNSCSNDSQYYENLENVSSKENVTLDQCKRIKATLINRVRRVHNYIDIKSALMAKIESIYKKICRYEEISKEIEEELEKRGTSLTTTEYSEIFECILEQNPLADILFPKTEKVRNLANLQLYPYDQNFVILGPNGTTVPKAELYKINWKCTDEVIIRRILSMVFDRETLAFYTLSGINLPAPHKNCTITKFQLNPKMIDDIIYVGVVHLYMDEKDVLDVITTKCADENKLLRGYLKPSKLVQCKENQIDEQIENMPAPPPSPAVLTPPLSPQPEVEEIINDVDIQMDVSE